MAKKERQEKGDGFFVQGSRILYPHSICDKNIKAGHCLSKSSSPNHRSFIIWSHNSKAVQPSSWLIPFASMSKKDETIVLRLSWILRLLKNLETTRAGKTSSRGTIIHVFRSLRLRTPSFSSTSSTPHPIVGRSAHIALIVLEKRYESKPEGSLTPSRIGYRVGT